MGGAMEKGAQSVLNVLFGGDPEPGYESHLARPLTASPSST